MKLIFNKVFLQHETGSHPESIKRLQAFGKLEETAVISGLPYINLIHPEYYVNIIKDACLCDDMIDQDTITSPGSFEAAIHAVGAAVMASGTNDFALVRPPVIMLIE